MNLSTSDGDTQFGFSSLTPEFIESCDLAREAKVATMSAHELMLEFLEHCNQRGSRYREGIDPFPTLSQIARYCGRHPATIFRIQKGKTKVPSPATTQIILAIGGIEPRVSVREMGDERYARLADADRWLSSHPKDRGELIDWILRGIRDREADKARLEIATASARFSQCSQ